MPKLPKIPKLESCLDCVYIKLVVTDYPCRPCVNGRSHWEKRTRANRR